MNEEMKKTEEEPVAIGAGRGAGYWGRFYMLLSIAAIVATIGLISDSGAVVIAAMLLAPLMEPILGIASVLVQGYLGRGARLLTATLVAAIVTVGWGYMILVLFDVPLGVEIPSEVMARTNPGLTDLLVALVAGIAGAYVQVRKEEAGLIPGVAIGVSLVPPLAAAGILLYHGQPAEAGDAALLFLTNLAAIVLSACAVFFALGIRPARRGRGAALGVGLGAAVSLLVVAIIAWHLTDRTLLLLREAREEQQISTVLKSWAGSEPVEIRKIEVSGDVVEIRLLFGVPWSGADQQVAPGEMVSDTLSEVRLRDLIAVALDRQVTLQLSGQIVFEATMEVVPPGG